MAFEIRFQLKIEVIDANMKKSVFSILTALTLAGCGSGPSLTPEQRTAQDAAFARNEKAVESATQTTVDGKTFRVALPEGTAFALVALVGTPTPYTGANLETAARNVTGCKATFGAGVLVFI
ncbi:hypothetical protein [Roseobacter sp.]|uniref:hypothetical protein n=1 Tax=Roseobacter sp. TaxID=1907202 RepID=UPI0032980F90